MCVCVCCAELVGVSVPAAYFSPASLSLLCRRSAVCKLHLILHAFQAAPHLCSFLQTGWFFWPEYHCGAATRAVSPPRQTFLEEKKKKKGGGPGQILPELNLISPHWLDMWYMKWLTAWLRMCLGFRSSAGRTWLLFVRKMKIQRDIDTNQPTFLLFSLLFRTSLHLFFTFTLYVIISLSWALVKHGWLHLPVKAMSVRHPDKGEHYVNVLYGYIWDL